MTPAPLLLEIGCEEIPARMIRAASRDLRDRVVGILDRQGLSHGGTSVWSGPRRLAVRVEEVAGRQNDREEVVLGPPAAVAFAPDGEPTRAARGFAGKHGIDPTRLERRTTERGEYVGFARHVPGRSIGEVLADALPETVEGMSFPKAMRWGDGERRWVRPVHWLLALHGETVLGIDLLGVRAGAWSMGHRFLSRDRVAIDHPDRYLEALEAARVVADPAERRARLERLLHETAGSLGGRLVEDPALLDEVSDLIEWPGSVGGRIDEAFLDLPREVLVTTLRHHQKCFSVQDDGGELLPAFVAVANTDRDPAGHVRRGNEWVIGGRLEDARFFWTEDRKRPLAERSAALEGVVFHAAVGTFAEKAARLEELAARIATRLEMDAERLECCRRAARLAKNDLVTETVGEFPELQGQVGGLMLLAEGEPEALARAVYSHYRPTGPDDTVPETPEGRVVALADKLDTIHRILLAGERPTGSRDPFGLRRAGNGIVRILLEGELPLALRDLRELTGLDDAGFSFLCERFKGFFRERGFTSKEIEAVVRPRVAEEDFLGWPPAAFSARLEAIVAVRDRADFGSLVKLTERVDTIVVRNAEVVQGADPEDGAAYRETDPAALELDDLVRKHGPRMERQSEAGAYPEIVQTLARFVDPVERFFTDVLVIDRANPSATRWRYRLLVELRELLTRYFDIRELAGQAERRST